MATREEIVARRARQRAQRRRRRIVIIAVVLAVAVVAACIAALPALRRMADNGLSPSQATVAISATPFAQSSQGSSSSLMSSSAPSPTLSGSPTATLVPSPSPIAVATYAGDVPAPRPPITNDFISFGAKRRAEMATYARRHYGVTNITLHPKLIVLHYTAGSTYGSAHATFESDTPNMGVLPGTVAHFVIDKDGAIYQQLPLTFMGRHAVGVNYCAIGIEIVQEGRASDALAVAQILQRPAQRKALVALVRWLMYRYSISPAGVIGHGMVNDSPYFKDLLGWSNDHVDWQKPQVLRLRALLKTTR